MQRLSLRMHAGCGFGGMHAAARTLRRLDLEFAGAPPAALDLSALELLRRRAVALNQTLNITLSVP